MKSNGNNDLQKRIILMSIISVVVIGAVIGGVIFINGSGKNEGKNPTSYEDVKKEDIKEPYVQEEEKVEDIKPVLYTVSFVDGEKELSKVEVEDGKTVKKPSVPTKKGYVFDGWYYENELYNFNYPIKKDIVIKAVFEKVEENAQNPVVEVKKYKVTFDYGDKTEVKTVKENEKIKEPSKPKKDGYRFVKWVINDKEYNFDMKVTQDITIKAEWAKVYKINDDVVKNVTLTNEELVNKFGHTEGISGLSIQKNDPYNSVNGRIYYVQVYMDFDNGYTAYYIFYLPEEVEVMDGIKNKNLRYLAVPLNDVFDSFSEDALTDENLLAIGATNIIRPEERSLLQFKYKGYTFERYGKADYFTIWVDYQDE